MFKFLHSNNIVGWILIPILLVLSKLSILSHGIYPHPYDTDGVLTKELVLFFDKQSGGYYFSVIIIYGVQLLLLYRLSAAYKILGSQSLLPCYLYLILCFYFPQFSYNLGIALAVLMLLVVLNIYLSFFEKNINSGEILNMALVVGLGTMFYKPFGIFFVILIFGILSYRNNGIKNFLIAIVGLMLPWYFYFSIEYLNTGVLDFRILQFVVTFNPFLYLQFTGASYFFAILYIAMLSAGFFKIQGSIQSMLIFNRNIYGILSIVIVLGIVLLFMTKWVDATIFHITTIPGCMMIAYQLKEYRKASVPEILIWCIIALSLFSNFYML